MRGYFTAILPLTPALSRREREKRRALFGGLLSIY
jgi:hypothetical protein